MDAEIKAKWLAALRSEKYEQGQSMLKYVDHRGTALYCCLGVLCDVVGVDWSGVGRRTTAHPLSGDVILSHVEGDKYQLAGLDEHEESILAAMNDDGKSFIEIADYIEKYL